MKVFTVHCQNDLILPVTYFTQQAECLRRVGIDVQNSEISILYGMRRAKIEKKRGRGEKVGMKEWSGQKGNLKSTCLIIEMRYIKLIQCEGQC